MVKEGTVLRYLVLDRGIEAENAKIKVIKKLSPPTLDKEIRSFV